jgi:hypothetical protein
MNRTASKEEREKNSQDRTARIRHQEKAARTGYSGQNSHNRTTRRTANIMQPGKDSQDKIARKGEPGQYSQERTGEKGLPEVEQDKTVRTSTARYLKKYMKLAYRYKLCIGSQFILIPIFSNYTLLEQLLKTQDFLAPLVLRRPH